MGVPNNFSYSLQTVVDEIPGVQTSLQGCFDDADNGLFDPNYGGPLYSGEGTGFDRLRNFRNYGEHIDSRSVTIRSYFPHTNVKSLYGTDPLYWNDVRSCVVPWVFETAPCPIVIGVKRTYSAIVTIWRSFLAFRLNGLTGTTTAVTLRLRRNSSVGEGKGFNIYRANWTDPLVTSDACSAFGWLLRGANSGYIQGDSSYVYTIEANEGDLPSFDAFIMDTQLFTALVHRYDYDNNCPDLGDDFQYAFYKGDDISQSLVWNAELRINYTGNPFLNAYAPLNGNWQNIFVSSNATVERVFISANDLNDWEATIDGSPAWVSILSPSTGSGSYKIDVRITDNTTSNERNATIRIGSDVHTDSLIYIHQEGVPDLYCTPNPYNVSYKDANYLVTVLVYPDTNNWTASFIDTGDGIGWISFVGGNTGTGDGAFTFNVEDNDAVARSCDIKLDSDAADYFVEVNQDAGGITGGALYIDNGSNQSDSISINVTPDIMHTTSSKVDTGDGTNWFNIVLGGTATGDFTLEIELTGIPPTSNKSAQVKIEDDNSGLYELVLVTYIYIT